MRRGTRYRVEKPSVNEWLTCPDIAVLYEVWAIAEAAQAWRAGQQAAKEKDAAIAAETAHLRSK